MRWCVPTLRESSRLRSISFRTWGRDIASRTAASVGLTSALAGETTISSPRRLLTATGFVRPGGRRRP
jgi:hypothetical protein